MKSDRPSEAWAVGEGAVSVPSVDSEPLAELETRARAKAARFVRWLAQADHGQVRRMAQGFAEQVRRAMRDKEGPEELRAAFARRLEQSGNVTREEIAAWHRVTIRQVNRWIRAGKLVKLPGYGRRAIFEARVACRLRPRRKEG